MNKPIEQFSEEELLAIIRRAENMDVPGSLYQRANNEWQIRHQKKMLEVAQGPHTGVFIAARNINNSGTITGPRVDITTESYRGTGEVSAFNAQKDNPSIGKWIIDHIAQIIVGVIVIAVAAWFRLGG